MKIITAFDSFKGSMTANEACNSAKAGILAAFPNADVLCLPMSDGGEGMVNCIAQAISTRMVQIKAHDSLMRVTDVCYALSEDGKTAYMEMAATSGLTLIPKALRDPMKATTYGVGEMILDAVNKGCEKIVMGIGGSATTDGGKGMADFLAPYLPLGIRMTVACDVSNPLYGENGAAFVYSPQKGATPEQVTLLDKRLRDFAAETVRRGFATSLLASHPGAGAAGGLGYGLMAYLGARLTSGIDLILDTIHFDDMIKGADLILTGEGKSDTQTLMGKVPFGILKRARKHGIPVALLSGVIENEDMLTKTGFSRCISINEGDNRTQYELMKPAVAAENMKRTVTGMFSATASKHQISD